MSSTLTIVGFIVIVADIVRYVLVYIVTWLQIVVSTHWKQSKVIGMHAASCKHSLLSVDLCLSPILLLSLCPR